MKHRIVSSLAFAAGIALMGGSAFAQVKIAYIDPLSGPFANVGEAGLKGFKEAAEILVNQKGGIMGQKLEFVGFDNKGSPQETQIQLKAAIDQGFRFVTQGNGSGAAHSLIDAINKWNARNPDKTVLFFNYAAVDRLNRGEYVVKEASMAKLKSTKVADEAIYSCLQMLGGYGYMEEYPLARLLRDSRLGPIGGGTSEIMREILSKMIIDKRSYEPAVKG